MSASNVVTDSRIGAWYRKPPITPLDSTSKNGLDTILGAWLVMFIIDMGGLLLYGMLCSVMAAILFQFQICVNFSHVSIFGTSSTQNEQTPCSLFPTYAYHDIRLTLYSGMHGYLDRKSTAHRMIRSDQSRTRHFPSNSAQRRQRRGDDHQT